MVWITPNLCHDMHDCDPAVGDRFLSHLLPPLLAALGRHGLLVLTWDEGSTDQGCCRLASGGHIATIVAGAGARPGARLATPVDQYSILQAIEDLLGLPRLRGAACPCTPSLAPLLVAAGAARHQPRDHDGLTARSCSSESASASSWVGPNAIRISAPPPAAFSAVTKPPCASAA